MVLKLSNVCVDAAFVASTLLDLRQLKHLELGAADGDTLSTVQVLYGG